MPVSAFGTQFTYPGQFSPWGGAQQGIQGLGINPYAFQQYTQNQPLMSAPLTSTIAGPSVGVQQVLPLLQVVPQQLQQLQQLSQLQQPIGQNAGLGTFSGTPQWGLNPQAFGAQPGHVM